MVHKKNDNIIYKIYTSKRNVFKINDIALLLGSKKTSALAKRLFYYVQTGKLLNPHRGFYAKKGYKFEELACLLYPPTYISLEYVLQRAGVIFQYDSAITNVSYLSRETEIEGQTFRYRKIKGEILVNTAGLILNNDNINIATPERAFLDMLYLDKHFYFDYVHILDRKLIKKLLPIYNSKALAETVNKVLQNDRYS